MLPDKEGREVGTVRQFLKRGIAMGPSSSSSEGESAEVPRRLDYDNQLATKVDYSGPELHYQQSLSPCPSNLSLLKELFFRNL